MEGGKQGTRKKTLGEKTKNQRTTNNKLNPHVTPGPRIEPGLQRCEANALTTVKSRDGNYFNTTLEINHLQTFFIRLRIPDKRVYNHEKMRHFSLCLNKLQGVNDIRFTAVLKK